MSTNSYFLIWAAIIKYITAWDIKRKIIAYTSIPLNNCSYVTMPFIQKRHNTYEEKACFSHNTRSIIPQPYFTRSVLLVMCTFMSWLLRLLNSANILISIFHGIFSVTLPDRDAAVGMNEGGLVVHRLIINSHCVSNVVGPIKLVQLVLLRVARYIYTKPKRTYDSIVNRAELYRFG